MYCCGEVGVGRSKLRGSGNPQRQGHKSAHVNPMTRLKAERSSPSCTLGTSGPSWEDFILRTSHSQKELVYQSVAVLGGCHPTLLPEETDQEEGDQEVLPYITHHPQWPFSRRKEENGGSLSLTPWQGGRGQESRDTGSQGA